MPRRVLLACLLAIAACDKTAPSPPPSPADKTHDALPGYAAYDAHVDGQAQIVAAEERARATHKRVLVMFGGNWCVWCRAFDAMVEGDARVKQSLDAFYVLVHVDSDANPQLNERYGHPYARGFPVFLVLSADGTLLRTQDSGAFERDDHAVGYDPDRVLVFLTHWSQ